MIHHWSLRTRFVVFATACLIPLLAVVVFFLDRGIERNADQIINTERTVAQLINQTLQSHFVETSEALANLSQQTEIVQLDRGPAETTLSTYRAALPLMSGIFLTDSTGTIIATSGPNVAPLRMHLASQFETTISTSDMLISDPMSLDDLRVVVMTYPVIPQTTEEAAAASNSTKPTQPAVNEVTSGSST